MQRQIYHFLGRLKVIKHSKARVPPCSFVYPLLSVCLGALYCSNGAAPSITFKSLYLFTSPCLSCTDYLAIQLALVQTKEKVFLNCWHVLKKILYNKLFIFSFIFFILALKSQAIQITSEDPFPYKSYTLSSS